MKLRIAQEENFNEIMEIINAAKRHLKDQGIDQWQHGYPDEELIHSDIAEQKGLLLLDDEEIVGYIYMSFDGEPAYNDIVGKWEYDEPYMVLHRLAISDKARGKGYGTEVFKLLTEHALTLGVHCCRVDTDSDNHKMQHIFKKNGFIERGIIQFEDSDKIAFEKRI